MQRAVSVRRAASAVRLLPLSRRFSPIGGAFSVSTRCASTTASGPSGVTKEEGPREDDAETDAARRKRAEEIRRQEQRMRWLRALVIPAFTLYGLFILRPTEGHFLRYLAERRHLDTSFNSLFPPLVRSEDEDPTHVGATSSHSKRPPQHASKAAAEGKASKGTVDDHAWLRRRFRTESQEDEERVARRKLLFARAHNYTASASDDGQVPMVVKSVEQRQRELEEQREHPPMHLLSEQLNTIAALSHAYRDAVAAAASEHGTAAVTSLPTPPIEIDFKDRTFCATANVTLRTPQGEILKSMGFLGACGMMWKQIA